MAKGTRAASQHGLNLHIHVTQATPRPAADARRLEGYDAAYGTARARRGSYEPLHQSTRISGTSASYAAGKQCTLHAGLCHPALDQRWCFGAWRFRVSYARAFSLGPCKATTRAKHKAF